MDGRSLGYAQEHGDLDDGVDEIEKGAIKPAADFALKQAEVVAKTIATLVKLLRQQLADVSELAQIVNSRLTYMCMRRLENQIVGGTGTGEDLLGGGDSDEGGDSTVGMLRGRATGPVLLSTPSHAPNASDPNESDPNESNRQRASARNRRKHSGKRKPKRIVTLSYKSGVWRIARAQALKRSHRCERCDRLDIFSFIIATVSECVRRSR